MKVESRKLETGDLEIILTFDKHEQMCLENDLVDIVDWYSNGPAVGKIYHCRKRLIEEHKDKILKAQEMQSKTMAEVNAILEDPATCVELISKHPEYKNRAAREEMSKRLGV